MGKTYYIPVQVSQAGTLALRTGRLKSGERIGIAFSSEASFRLAMGASGQWVCLDGEVLKGILAPLGVQHFRVDPRLAFGTALLEAC